MYSLDNEDRIEKYKKLPITYFKNILANFVNVDINQYDIVCDILITLCKRWVNPYSFVLSNMFIQNKYFFQILNSVSKVEAISLMKLKNLYNLSIDGNSFKSFVSTEFKALKMIIIDQKNQNGSLEWIRLMRILSK